MAAEDFQGGERLPYSSDAEQIVLGSVIVDSECMSSVAQIIPKPEYFYLDKHRTIYTAMLDLYVDGKAINFVTLLQEMKKYRGFNESEDKAYLVSLGQAAISTSSVEVYAQIVRENFDVRSLILASRKTIEESVEGTMAADVLIDMAEQRIFDIRQGKSIQGLQHISEVIQETYNRLDKLNAVDNDEMKPLSTGIGGIDKYITGLNRSDLILLAARPGMGKTSFALNIARSVAAAQRSGEGNDEGDSFHSMASAKMDMGWATG